MTTIGSNPRALKPDAIDVEGVAPLLTTIAALDPALGRTLAERVDTSVYTRANVPERIFGAHARAALSSNDFERFAAIADGTERLAIERVGRRVNTVMVLAAGLVFGGTVASVGADLGIGLTAALELVTAGATACLAHVVHRCSGRNSDVITRRMTSELAQLQVADGDAPQA